VFLKRRRRQPTMCCLWRKKKQRKLKKEKNKGIPTYQIVKDKYGKTILGKGGECITYNGAVFEGNKKIKKCAIKVYDKMGRFRGRRGRLINEVEIMKIIPPHPNIVTYYDSWEDDLNYYIAMEYAGKRNLVKYFEANKNIAIAKKKNIMRQMLIAVKYLHSIGIFHRDIKLENFVIDKEGIIRLIDFGYSEFDPHRLRHSKVCGTPLYAPPELVFQQEYDGFKIDVWSLGVCYYAILSDKFPFDIDSIRGSIDSQKDSLYRKIRGIYEPDYGHLNEDMAVIIKRMLNKDPNKRCCASNINL